ncbi:hypothetical protein [Leeuwenhoekiella blandensis]|uniref:Uncharacterized protein n=1 Tax=Leeuwenhoekiella blandensis (strain CECT 7118 / CCUG 51940 / KCTC 22103 / MED217) TaxID=398720 RepID=A3XLJ5_LEEBM|nr:hypothetical protein [Leeuwenhoekiella blandensis]EAQ49573.1 hypothetical protein MED217_11979 [Leeuwenhoekiella blandensis MED217]
MPYGSGIIYSVTGYLYLWIRYRNKNKVMEVLQKEYDGRYYDAGARLILSIFGIALIGLIILLLVAVIGRFTYDLIY